MPVSDASGATSREVFQRRPERLCTEIALADEESRTRFHYLVQGMQQQGDSKGC